MNWKKASNGLSENNDKKPLIILSGPTAAGKTDLSISLAKTIGGEIISADSMQVYKGFYIGTAKISREEMQDVPHYLIDILEADEEFNVYEFQKRTLSALETIYRNGNIPIIVGGTGFYIQSILYDIAFTEEETDKTYRRSLEVLAEKEGPESVHKLLEEADPEAAAQIHANNIKRTIRALEFFRETGQKISEHNEEQRQKISPYNFAYFVLNRDRQILYERIDLRVDQMMEEGLLEEVRTLLESGVSPNSLAMQGLGYKEIVDYLQERCSLEEAVYNIKIGTRHFAKRQLTWFRREKDVLWLNYEDFENDKAAMLAYMMKILSEKRII
ncbi:MAG: tRNA (adenosine(37)-N6)-dimethylallyltransferase MiaA [Parasporobacterium sp.]|nr:tRNA (adenosine(37)-N6)-dimethylallyltransferase MiaA [Parasporobacterium sp.]MBR3643061.1 tRNA (adenosine(37)-N6)-dimethylallyltransferase MiaA [Parasporobacterium sp.]